MIIPAFRSFVPFPGVMASAGGSGVAILGTPTGLTRAAGAATTFNYTLVNSTVDGLIVLCFDDNGQGFTSATWTATGQTAQTMFAAVERTAGTTKFRIFRLAAPTFGATGAGVISVPMSATTATSGIIPISVTGWDGTGGAGGNAVATGRASVSGGELDPAPFTLTGVVAGSLIIHGVCAGDSTVQIPFAAPEIEILDAAGPALRWAVAQHVSAVGGDVTLDTGSLSQTSRIAEGAVALAPDVALAPAWNYPPASSLNVSAVRTVMVGDAGLAQPDGTWDYIKLPQCPISEGATLRMFYCGATRLSVNGGYYYLQALGMMSTTDPNNAASWTRHHASPAATFVPGGAGATNEEGYFQIAVRRDPVGGQLICAFGGADHVSGVEEPGTPDSQVDISTCWQSSSDNGQNWTPNNYAGRQVIIPQQTTAWARGTNNDEFWPGGIWYDPASGPSTGVWHMIYETNNFNEIYHVATAPGAAFSTLSTRASSSNTIWNVSEAAAEIGVTATQLRACIADRGNGLVDIVVTLINSSFNQFRVARIPVIDPRAAWTGSNLGNAVLLYQFGSEVTNGITDQLSTSINFAQAFSPCVHGGYFIMPYALAGKDEYWQKFRYLITPAV